ncbi:MAG: hypothetical protein EOO62_17835 [Hymenobacter sp.]|nr:MAG: hypothetical protein EOO62_17835 [Hymenobacter sp.]
MLSRFFLRAASLALPIALASCSATERTAETAAPRSVSTEQVVESATPATVPTEVNSDADRRAIYNANAPRGSAARIATPDATPNVMRLGEQASDINRIKRPETLNTNDANNTTTETRLQRIDQVVADPQRQP